MRINVNPVSKPRMTRRDKWKKRAVVEKYYQYKDDLNSQIDSSEIGDRIEIKFFLLMPKSWSKKKQSTHLGKPHQQRPDIDNLCKAFLDALVEEDSYIYEIKASKYWTNEEGYIEFSNLE